MSYGSDYPAIFGAQATNVGRILNGASPETFPSSSPQSRADHHLKTRKPWVSKLPAKLLATADEVIE